MKRPSGILRFTCFFQNASSIPTLDFFSIPFVTSIDLQYFIYTYSTTALLGNTNGAN